MEESIAREFITGVLRYDQVGSKTTCIKLMTGMHNSTVGHHRLRRLPETHSAAGQCNAQFKRHHVNIDDIYISAFE